MSEKYKFRDPNGLYFTTSTIVFWIDLFTRKEFKHIVIDSLKFCQKEKGLVIHAWCLMPSHLHMIVSSETGSLSEIMRDFKKFTSKTIISELDQINESRKEWLIRAFKQSGRNLNRIKEFKVWQDGNKPKAIVSNSFLDEKLMYIHQNPVDAEMVDEPEDYLYSSARDYCGIKGLLEVRLLE
ncbi:REP-associated tyrosine transposase [Ekhidna sp. To15]|uniref:REP-associated tyrosine transposase n=1 Tax=Ekhidna sp. To15 TaxID=3395267 RepID=UPI003F522E51